MIRILFSAAPGTFDTYRAPLARALEEAGIAAVVEETTPDPATLEYIVYAPNGPLADFSPYTGCKAVLSLWAGVERIVGNATLTQPLCRMVDPALSEGMVEWVSGHVLRHHLGMDAHILGQDGQWRGGVFPPLARERTVGILGLGELGRACAVTLSGLGFRVEGWSRTAREVPGIACHSGEEGLSRLLSRAEILVLLLPLTAGTENLLDAARIALLPRGAVVINPGRGPLIDDGALIAALDDGRLAHATLDVFRVEPLPPDHPFWAHPRVTVTPHVAAATRPESASRVVAENIRRGQAGEPLLYRVDRDRGY